eukprot:11154138-Alexandrium_andersonii.AAC.1
MAVGVQRADKKRPFTTSTAHAHAGPLARSADRPPEASRVAAQQGQRPIGLARIKRQSSGGG